MPIALGPVDAETVPEALAELNWIPWNEQEPADPLDRVAAVCSTSIESFQAAELLRARAEGWIAGGRQTNDLPDTKRELSGLLAAAALGIRVDADTAAFLAAATRATRRATAKAALRGLSWAVFAVALVVAGTRVAEVARNASEREALDELVLAGSNYPFAAGHAVQVAAFAHLTQQAGQPVSTRTRDNLIQLLSDRWPIDRTTGMDGPDGWVAVNAVVLDDDGGMVWAAGSGDLWQVDARTQDPRLLGHVSEAPLYDAAASADRSRFAALDAAGRLLVWEGGSVAGFDVPGAEQAEISDAGDTAVAWSSTALFVADLASPNTPVETLEVGEVLAVARVDGRLVAAAHADGMLTLIDCRSGETLNQLPSLPDPPDGVAISTKGHMVIEHGGELSFFDGQDLAPTGIRPGGLLTALALTARDEVIWASYADGTRMYDLRNQQRLFDPCGRLVATRLTLSAGEALLACAQSADIQVWPLDDARPAGPPGASADTASSAQAGDRQVAIIDGLVSLANPSGTYLFDPTGRSSRDDVVRLSPAYRFAAVPTVVALDRNQLALGASDGTVLILDVDDAMFGPARRWRSPDGSPVKSLAFAADDLTVSTATSSWAVARCVGCGLRVDAALDEVRSRALPCYPEAITQSVSRRVMGELGLRVCGD
ncbi:MAG: hypothetical protein LBS56_01605 [Propionibacteriaceae bacterium]|nr:hypothetical protein [Propionibacteriaceae bacterium]